MKPSVVKTEAQRWAETAVAFIATAAATGIFALLSYLWWAAVPWLGKACAAVAVLCAIGFFITAGSIIRWWIVLARRTQKPKRVPDR